MKTRVDAMTRLTRTEADDRSSGTAQLPSPSMAQPSTERVVDGHDAIKANIGAEDATTRRRRCRQSYQPTQ